MWGAKIGESAVRAVGLSDGERVAASEFELHADNDNPRGIWSNGVTMFVLDGADDKIYTYRVGVVKVSGGAGAWCGSCVCGRVSLVRFGGQRFGHRGELFRRLWAIWQ